MTMFENENTAASTDADTQNHTHAAMSSAQAAHAAAEGLEPVTVPEAEAAQAAAVPNGFAAFGLDKALLASIARMGFTAPTGVQEQAIPQALKGGDWMVSSQTGSGKTAAFLLPVLDALIRHQAQAPQPQPGAPNQNPWTKGGVERKPAARKPARFAPVAPAAVVLCPTRELAQQVAADAIAFVHGLRGLRVATVVGGVSFIKQVADLQNASLVIATPGRLLDLQEQGKLRLDSVRHLVLDEADRMLDLGFAEDLERIATACAQREQTLMFSATFAPRIMQLASAMMRNPGRLELATAQDRHDDIRQVLHWADGLDHKKHLLGHWLRSEGSEQILVFASTQIDCEALAEELVQEGYDAAALHGAMPQHVRNRRLQGLRDGRVKILVATDVAARGIDVPTISHVINFGLPMKAEDYVHRIGRTGRAGRSGLAVTLAEFRERHKIRAIEQYMQQIIKAEVIPGLEPAERPKFAGPRRDLGRGPKREGYGRMGGYAREQAPRDAHWQAAPRDSNGQAGPRDVPWQSAPRAAQVHDFRAAPRRDEARAEAPWQARPRHEGARHEGAAPWAKRRSEGFAPVQAPARGPAPTHVRGSAHAPAHAAAHNPAAARAPFNDARPAGKGPAPWKSGPRKPFAGGAAPQPGQGKPFYAKRKAA